MIKKMSEAKHKVQLITAEMISYKTEIKLYFNLRMISCCQCHLQVSSQLFLIRCIFFSGATQNSLIRFTEISLHQSFMTPVPKWKNKFDDILGLLS